jgi:hypothetical protein
VAIAICSYLGDVKSDAILYASYSVCSKLAKFEDACLEHLLQYLYSVCSASKVDGDNNDDDDDDNNNNNNALGQRVNTEHAV